MAIPRGAGRRVWRKAIASRVDAFSWAGVSMGRQSDDNGRAEGISFGFHRRIACQARRLGHCLEVVKFYMGDRLLTQTDSLHIECRDF